LPGVKGPDGRQELLVDLKALKVLQCRLEGERAFLTTTMLAIIKQNTSRVESASWRATMSKQRKATRMKPKELLASLK
jgi:hypothetical protein